jgi:hypothetical protein
MRIVGFLKAHPASSRQQVMAGLKIEDLWVYKRAMAILAKRGVVKLSSMGGHGTYSLAKKHKSRRVSRKD